MAVRDAANLGQLCPFQNEVELEHKMMQVPAASPARRDGGGVGSI
ncbi:hypothetical protein MU1_01380 [Paenibacillus glycanilyticus]|uniref:Uncharacterized protein n=1 Tax=Paenibacillus glycanilyticus TaxID=126569 RepID=A0ABQ6G498_9BACL|nr:hypothetical protein MU1_01380 [Paenibacillus glycanilyticus]